MALKINTKKTKKKPKKKLLKRKQMGLPEPIEGTLSTLR
jgi:hypothetical protein